MKHFLLQLLILFLLGRVCYSQPCFDWSIKTTSATHAASTYINVINGTDLLEVTSTHNSFSLPPTITKNIHLNGSASSSFTIYNSNSTFTIGTILKGDNGFYYTIGFGQINFNGNIYTGTNIIKYSGSSMVDVFPISGSLLHVDSNSDLYVASFGFIRRLSGSGTIIDSAAFSNTIKAFDKSHIYTTTNGDTIRRFLYPDILIQTLIIPGFTDYFHFLNGTIRYYISKPNSQTDTISVFDSTGVNLYTTSLGVGYNNFVLDKDGYIYARKNLNINKFGPLGQIWSTTIDVYSNSSATSSAISNLQVTDIGDLYFSGAFNYDLSNVFGPNPKLAYFIKPNCYRYFTGGSPFYEYVGFMGKINANGSGCSDYFSPPGNIKLCKGGSGTYIGNSQNLYGGQYYSIELSDSSGSFTNPIYLGGSSSPLINYNVPQNLPAGNYQIRGVLKNPDVYSPGVAVNIHADNLDGIIETNNMVYDINVFKNFACLPSSIIAHANTTGMKFKLVGRNAYNYDYNITQYSSDSTFNFTNTNLFNKPISIHVQHTSTGCEKEWLPSFQIVTADTMVTRFSCTDYPGDTITFCQNAIPVKLSLYPQPSATEIINNNYITGSGVYYNAVNKNFFFYPDSVTPGYHTIVYDISNSGIQCGVTKDSITFFVDTCLINIVTGIVAPKGFLCGSELLNVSFNTIGNFNPNNVFKVLLNNQVIGQGTASPITLVVPEGYYLNSTFRVISTSPIDTGTFNYDGPFDIINYVKPYIISTPSISTCYSQGTILKASGSLSHFNWYINDILVSDSIQQNLYFTADQIGTYKIENHNYLSDGCHSFSDPVEVLDSIYFNITAEVISDTGLVCQGDTIKVIIHSVPGSTFTWFWGRKVINNMNDSMLIITRGAPSSVHCEIQTPGGCKVIKNISLPAMVPRINSNNYNDAPDTLIKCVTSFPNQISEINQGGITYQWYIDGILSLGDTLYKLITNMEGDYQVLMSNSLGCSTYSDVYKIKIDTIKLVSITPNYSTFFCENDSVQLLATGNIGNQYTWFKDSYQVPNETDSLIYVKQAGSYVVSGTALNGCENFQISPYRIQVVEAPCPTPQFAPSLPTAICPSDSLLLQVLVEPNDEVVWIVNGIVDTSLNVPTLLITQPGSYSVFVKSEFGCTTYSDTLNIIQGTLPVATTIALGNTTFCQGDSVSLRALYVPFSDYQWYRNQILIPGATSQIYKAKTGGLYTVKVTNADGCSNISNPISVQVPCMPLGEDVEKLVNDEDVSNLISIFPNPVDNVLTVSVEAKQSDKLQIELFDFSGRLSKIFELEVNKGKSSFEFKMNDLVAGMYSLHISGVHFNESFKVIKQ